MKPRQHLPVPSLEAFIERAVRRLFPGIGRYDRPIYGRVTAVTQQAGLVTAARKLWSCDIQPLTLDLQNDSSRPLLKDVPLDPIQISASGTAMFPKPFPGMVVRVAWMGGSRAHPFILSFTSEGQMVPIGQMGELSDLLYKAVQLLSMPRLTAVGPGPYDAATQAQLTELLLRIPI